MSDVTLDVEVPDGTAIENIDAGLGNTTQVDSLVRWHVPRLAAGGQATLKLRGLVAPLVASKIELCVMLLSAGAPLEHCAAYETVTGPATPEDSEDSGAPLLPTAERSAAPNLGLDSGLGLGWLLLLLGAVGIGVWLALQRRGARRNESTSGD
jgi:hypothetical protein